MAWARTSRRRRAARRRRGSSRSSRRARSRRRSTAPCRAPLPGGCTSRPRESRASRRLDRRRRWRARAASRARRRPAARAARRGRSATRVAPAAGHRRGLELERRRRVGLLPQQRAQLAVVEGRERPRQLPAGGAPGGVHDAARRSSGAARRPARAPQPRGRDRAGRGLALADLVAVDDQHARAGAGQLARDGEPREARAADEHVAVALQAGALRAPLRRSNRHSPGNDTAALRFARCRQ